MAGAVDEDSAVLVAVFEAATGRVRASSHSHTPPATTSDGGDDADDHDPLPTGALGRLASGELPLELALGRIATLLVGGHALVLPQSPRMAGK